MGSLGDDHLQDEIDVSPTPDEMSAFMWVFDFIPLMPDQATDTIEKFFGSSPRMTKDCKIIKKYTLELAQKLIGVKSHAKMLAIAKKYSKEKGYKNWVGEEIAQRIIRWHLWHPKPSCTCGLTY